MGNTTPEIRASVEDVLSNGQRLIAEKASACQDAARQNPKSTEFARACFEQYAEGVADLMDALDSCQLGDSMRTFAQLKVMQMQDTPSSH